MKKSILLGLGAFAGIVAPIATVISCGSTPKAPTKNKKNEYKGTWVNNANKAKFLNMKKGEKFPANLFSGETKLTSLTINVGQLPIYTSYLTSGFLKGATSLTALKISNPNLTSIGEYVFSHNTSIQNLDLSGSTNLKVINRDAFYAMPLQTLKLSGLNKLKTIGWSSFWTANLSKGIDFSSLKSLQSIGENAFYNYKGKNLNLSVLPQLKTIGRGAFDLSVNLESLNLSGLTNLTTIGPSAFKTTKKLMKVNMSGATNLSMIDTNAFTDAPITELDISGLTSLAIIGDYAFQSARIKTLNLSQSHVLSKIGENAFYSSRLTYINLSSRSKIQSTVVGKSAFEYTIDEKTTKVETDSSIMSDAMKDQWFGAGSWSKITFILIH